MLCDVSAMSFVYSIQKKGATRTGTLSGFDIGPPDAIGLDGVPVDSTLPVRDVDPGDSGRNECGNNESDSSEPLHFR